MSAAGPTKKKPKRRRAVLMRWVKATIGNDRTPRRALVAADAYAMNVLAKRKYGIGQLVSADVKGARNPGFHRKAHALATLVIENVDEFSRYAAHADEHEVLKRLQIESDTCCDHIRLDKDLEYRIPQSLAFEDMDEPTFGVFYRRICNYISSRYWPDLDEFAIEELARFATEVS